MKNHHLQELQRILSALQIFSPTAFALAGQVFNLQPDPAPLSLPANQPTQNPLIQQLEQQLYLHCYCQKFQGKLRPPLNEVGDDLLDALSQANGTQERWELGWQIQQLLPSGQLLVHKSGMSRMIWPGEFISQDGPGTPPRVGALVNIFAPKESRVMQPGFYFAFGETSVEQNDLHEAVRFYWNIQANGATTLMQLLTEALNRFQVPFRFKCSSYRALFYRIDSAVLFVSRQYYHITAEVLVDLYQPLKPYLQPETPLFTKRLAPGLAFAEEPGTGESFGMSRCRLLAEGVWNAYMQGISREAARLQVVQQHFASNGVTFERPYLRPGAVDHYEWPAYR